VTGLTHRVRLDRTGLLFVLLFCNTFGVGAFGPLLPEIGRSQSLPDWQLGLLASAFGFARMAAAMPAGVLVARRLSASLMASPLILILGLALLVSPGPLPVLLAGRFVLGISHTLTMVGGLTAILLGRGSTASAWTPPSSWVPWWPASSVRWGRASFSRLSGRRAGDRRASPVAPGPMIRGRRCYPTAHTGGPIRAKEMQWSLSASAT